MGQGSWGVDKDWNSSHFVKAFEDGALRNPGQFLDAT